MFQLKTLKIICLTFVAIYAFIYCTKPHTINHAITSDGEGYYSYLPAIYLLKDKTFQKNNETKFKHTGEKNDYILEMGNGRFVNKYFAGVSLMATPAFLLITAALEVSGIDADGYNIHYHIGMYAFSLLLFCFGFWWYSKLISAKYQLSSNQKWIFLVILIATPWFFTSMYAVMYANNYLFFCFVAALALLLKIKEEPTKRGYIYLFFFLVGLVTVIRPTSLLFLVILPYFFDSWKDFMDFVKTHLLKLKTIVIGLLLYALPVAYQFGVWKWQSGSYFLWSYGGEGFNWLNPQLFEVFFGYRNGILFHSPLLLLPLIYSIVVFRKQRFKSIIYLLYFFLVCYMSASWWCYDFETKYGLRNFNEFYVFLLLPLFDMVKVVQSKKWILIPVVLFTLLPFVRFNQFVFDYNNNQRYTASSYWQSLVFWKAENKQRWQFYRSVPPYGTSVSHEVLLEEDVIKFTKDDEFLPGSKIQLQLQPGERAYARISMKRHLAEEYSHAIPLLVFDYTSPLGEEHRAYNATPLFNDKLATEEEVVITRYFFDNKGVRDELLLYIWNKDRAEGMFTDVKITLEKYGRKH